MGICASSKRVEQELECDENVVYVMDEQCGGGGGGGAPGEEDAPAACRKVASLFSQKGKKGPNQDAVILCQGFGMEDGVFCGVFDGHGRCGQYVSKLVRDYLPFMILSHRNALFLGVVVDGRQRRRVVAVAGAAAGRVAGGLRQRVRGYGQGAQAPAQPGLQLQRHHRRVRHEAGQGPHRRQPRRLQGGARHHVGRRLPPRRPAHRRPQTRRGPGGGADQALRRPRVRAQGRAVGAARVAPRRGLPGARHGAVAGGPPAEAARRGVGAGGGAPPRRARRPVHRPRHRRRVGRAEQRGGGVHRLRHPEEAARVQGRRGGRGATVADQVPVVARRRLLRRLPLPQGPGLGRHRRCGQGQGGERAARTLLKLSRGRWSDESVIKCCNIVVIKLLMFFVLFLQQCKGDEERNGAGNYQF